MSAMTSNCGRRARPQEPSGQSSRHTHQPDLQWDHEGLNINGEKLNHLRFADDLILFSECPTKLQQMSDQSAKAGLTMNTAKTKNMTNTS